MSPISISPDPKKYMDHASSMILDDSVRGMKEGLNALHGRVPGPPTAARKPFIFVSAKQRRYVMAAIKTGLIKVPYRRTNDMVRRMNTRVERESHGVKGYIGTATPYAPWVISSDETPSGLGPQARYHQGTWWTLQDVVKKNISVVIDAIKKSIGAK